jgi:hypothetical protein
MKKNKLLIAACLFLFTLLSSGCVPLIVGGAVGALGGYAVSRDTIEGDTDKDYNALWNVAVSVGRTKGIITADDRPRGYLELEVDSSRVIVRLIRLTKTANRLRVTARNKLKLPNFSLAEDIFVKILEQTSPE